MSSSTPTAVLLMAYGTPPSTAERDVEAYLAHVLEHYRKAVPTDDEVRGLQARYEAIGGSPLYGITERIVSGVQDLLDRLAPGGYRVCSAFKHSPPFIDEVVRRIAAEGVGAGVGVALAPFPSRMSTEAYFAEVRTASSALSASLDWGFRDRWHMHPRFIELWESLLKEALTTADEPTVLFTNHSLPARIRQWNDPYEQAFEETTSLLVDRLQLAKWRRAYQSAGGGTGEWLGPGFEEVLRQEAERGESRFVVAPIGFLTDHLEVLYDIDVVAMELARELGVELTRTRMPNDDERLIGLLADLVVAGPGPRGPRAGARVPRAGARG